MLRYGAGAIVGAFALSILSPSENADLDSVLDLAGILALKGSAIPASGWEAHEPGRVASDRSLSWHYQIEEFIDDQEYSTELFFRNGEMTFVNVTRKRTHVGATHTKSAILYQSH